MLRASQSHSPQLAGAAGGGAASARHQKRGVTEQPSVAVPNKAQERGHVVGNFQSMAPAPSL
eukprot:1180908-Prorocentrum_minimum.AAC.1